MSDRIYSEKERVLIKMLAEGQTMPECRKTLSEDPHLVPIETVEKWLADAELLKEVIERSNDLIGQAWGTMWLNIKRNAMLGSVPHSKLLIEFVQNGKRLAVGKLSLIFDRAVAG